MAMLLITQYGAKAQSEPDIIWHTPGVSADFLVLSPDGQYVYANRGDSKLGNVFSQLRVDNGTIIRKDVNTVGHIAGFTADGRHAIVVNLRLSKVIYKVETESLEKVDSLELSDVQFEYTLSFAISYDNKYLYVGSYGQIFYPKDGPDYPYNFFAIDIETFELVHKDSFIYPSGAGGTRGEVLGIYPSPDNNYIALNVSPPTEATRLLVLDVRDNYKNIATNPAIEYQSYKHIGDAAFTMDNSKLFVCVGGPTFSAGEKKVLIYNYPKFVLTDSLLYPSHPNRGGGAVKVKPSLLEPSVMYVASILPKFITDQAYRDNTLQKINTVDSKEICKVFISAEVLLPFIPYFTFVENETNIIAYNAILGTHGIFKFKNCTPTSVEDDKNTIHTLQVIDNKLHLNIPVSTMFEYQISDIRGNPVQNGTQSQSIIDVSPLAAGTYFLLITTTDQSKSYKFMMVR